MLKFHCGIIILLFFFGIGTAQKYEKLTQEEKSIIDSNPEQLMRVYNTSVEHEKKLLKQVSKPINPKDKYTKKLVERMYQAVLDPNNRGVGIAAPQVGINRRIFLVERFDKQDKPFEVFINPEIVWASELMQEGGEGDLSFEERGDVMRHYIIGVKYYNLEGELIQEILEGFTAVIFQHERDHLDGILLTDRIEEQKTVSYEIPSIGSGLYKKSANP